MKLMKRLTALVLSAAMVLSMSVTALATGGENTGETAPTSVKNAGTVAIMLDGQSYENGTTIEIGENDFPVRLQITSNDAYQRLRRYKCIEKEGKENTYELDERYQLNIDGNLVLEYDEKGLADKISNGLNFNLNEVDIKVGDAKIGDISNFTYSNTADNVNASFSIKVVASPYYELRDANGNAITDLGKEPVDLYLYHIDGETETQVTGLDNENKAIIINGNIIVEHKDNHVHVIPRENGSVKVTYYDGTENHELGNLTVSGIDYELRDLNENVITTIGAEPVYAILYDNGVPVDLNGENGLSPSWDDEGSVNVTYQSYVVGDFTYQAAVLTGVKNGQVTLSYNRGYYTVATFNVEGVVSYDLYTSTSTEEESFVPYDDTKDYWGTTYFKLKNDSTNEWVDINDGFMEVFGDNFNEVKYIDDYTLQADLIALLRLRLENGMEYQISPERADLVFTNGAILMKEVSQNTLKPFNVSLDTNGRGTIEEFDINGFKVVDQNGNDVSSYFNFADNSSADRNHYRAKITINDTLPNGVYIISYTGSIKDRNHQSVEGTASMLFRFSGQGVSYLLTREDKLQLTLRTDQTADGNITREYAVIVYQFENGVATVDVTEQVKDITLLAKDNNSDDAIGDENAAKCIYLGTNSEGKQVICTTNAVQGHYTVTATVTMEDGTTFNQTMFYDVGNHSSAGNTYYVGTQAGDFPTIQAALDKVNEDTSGGTWTVIIRDGEYEEDINFVIDNTVYRDLINITAEGENAVITGTMNLSVADKSLEHKSSTDSKYNFYIQGLNFVAKDSSKTAITIDPYMTFDDNHGVGLQKINISGYATGISGSPAPNRSRNIKISNCDAAIILNGIQYDLSSYVYREWNFIDNDVAIDLNNASGQFKMRDSQFSGNGKNIVANSTSCAVVNAAFNNYLHNGVNPGESIDSYFSLKDGNAKYFYSPYTSKSEASRAATSDFYIDPAQMKGLIIDAEEAKQVVNSSNFKGQDIVIDIVTTTENEDTGFTTSEAYATWNFGTDVTANAVAMDFTPRIDRELTEASLAVVEAEGIESYQPVSFAHSGDLPAVATVELNETVALNGDLYLYKVVGSELVLQEEGVTYENGIYTFDRPTCSDYIITDTEIKNEDDSDNDDQGGSGDNTGSGENDKPNQGGSLTPSDDDDSNNYIPVSEVKNKLNNTSKDTVTLNVESRDQLSAKIFEELAKHPEKTLVLKGDGYTLSIKGDDVVRKLSSSIFDADIRSSSPNRNKIRKLIGSDVNVQFIHSDFHGMLPGKMVLRIKVEDSLKNKVLNCYHYNEKQDKVELVASDLKADAKGYVEIIIDHFSTYILTDSKLDTNSPVSSEKTNPSTGTNDMVALAAAMAVVSVMGVAVLNRKR